MLLYSASFTEVCVTLERNQLIVCCFYVKMHVFPVSLVSNSNSLQEFEPRLLPHQDICRKSKLRNPSILCSGRLPILYLIVVYVQKENAEEKLGRVYATVELPCLSLS